MRVVVVTSRYTEGVEAATGGPGRVARELRDAGHVVSLYAGWSGERTPLETWTETYQAGIPVHFIATTPWDDTAATGNFDNPDVETDFRLYLKETRPDLVFASSLQGLGVGIIRASADAGVRVVVGAGDLWLICARGALRDRSNRSCSTVVACGMCHCAVNRDWLDARDEVVRAALMRADEIVAQTEQLGSTLRANGIGLDPRGPMVVVAPTDNFLVGSETSRQTRRRDPRSVENVLLVSGFREGPRLRYRGHFAKEALALAGVRSWVRHYRSPEVPALAAIVDAVVLHHVPPTQQLLAMIIATRSRGIPVYYDIDDGVPDERLLLHCDAAIAATTELADRVGALGVPAQVWADGVGVGPARCSDAALAAPRSPGPLRIGYLHEDPDDADWTHIEPAVLEVLRTRRDAELWLAESGPDTNALARLGSRVRRVPWKPWWEFAWTLRDLDVNLAPRAPDAPPSSASRTSWLEAALAETVTVASAIDTASALIARGRTGLVPTTPAEVAAAIMNLLDDETQRLALGKSARDHVLACWSPHLQGRRYVEILECGELAQRADGSRAGSAVTSDEPWVDIAVEGYIVPDPMVLARIDPSPRSDEGTPVSPMADGGLGNLRARARAKVTSITRQARSSAVRRRASR